MDIEVSSHAPEIKAGIGGAVAVTHDEVMRLFDEFKAANDERLGQIERRSADVVTEDKVERINAALTRRLDELTLKSARPSLGREARATSHDALEHKAAFDSYMRAGETAGLRALEVKAMSAGTNADGGYTVPVEIEQSIGARLTAISPIRSIAGQRTISGGVYKKPFMTTGPAVGWVGETGARTQTNSPVLDSLSFPAMESTPCRRRRRPCWRTPRSTSTSGSRPKWSRPSPCRRGPPSSPATAPTSRRACLQNGQSLRPNSVGSGRKRDSGSQQPCRSIQELTTVKG